MAHNSLKSNIKMHLNYFCCYYYFIWGWEFRGAYFLGTCVFFFSLMLLNDINTPVKSFTRKNHECDLSGAKIKFYETTNMRPLESNTVCPLSWNEKSSKPLKNINLELHWLPKSDKVVKSKNLHYIPRFESQGPRVSSHLSESYYEG